MNYIDKFVTFTDAIILVIFIVIGCNGVFVALL